MKAARYDHISDADLLTAHQATGDLQPLGALLERYTLLLLGVCLKYLRDEDAAKDAVQQVHLKVLHEAGRHQIQFFKSWLYMVAKNHCLMELRRRSRTLSLNDGWDAPGENAGEGESVPLTEASLDLLPTAMESLPPPQRDCLTRFYLQKQSYHGIEAATGFTFMQVKSHIQNGKRNLKLYLAKALAGRTS